MGKKKSCLQNLTQGDESFYFFFVVPSYLLSAWHAKILMICCISYLIQITDQHTNVFMAYNVYLSDSRSGSVLSLYSMWKFSILSDCVSGCTVYCWTHKRGNSFAGHCIHYVQARLVWHRPRRNNINDGPYWWWWTMVGGGATPTKLKENLPSEGLTRAKLLCHASSCFSFLLCGVFWFLLTCPSLFLSGLVPVLMLCLCCCCCMPLLSRVFSCVVCCFLLFAVHRCLISAAVFN